MAGQNKSLGELLYECCAEAFNYQNRWAPHRKPLTCQQYEEAARAFAKALRTRYSTPSQEDETHG